MRKTCSSGYPGTDSSNTVPVVTVVFFITGTNDHFHINLEDEVTRGAIVLKAGELLWPAPPPPSMAIAAKTTTTPATTKLEPPNPFNVTLKDTFLYSTGMSFLNYFYLQTIIDI